MESATTTRCLKALMMTTMNEDILAVDHIFTDYLEDENVDICQTTYDQFKEGSRQNRFDCVVALLLDEKVSADDVEKMKEYYKHYAKAPIFIWVSLRVKEGLE